MSQKKYKVLKAFRLRGTLYSVGDKVTESIMGNLLQPYITHGRIEECKAGSVARIQPLEPPQPMDQ